MTVDLIARTSQAASLKTNLDGISRRVRAIADRVANASANPRGFSLPGDAQTGSGDSAPIDLEKEMAGLADEQLRFEATARLLQKTYAGLRASLRDK